MYRHIIFDLDGTLLDTLNTLLSVGNHLCRAHGWPEYDREPFSRFIGGSLGQLIQQLVPPGPDAEALCLAAEQEFSTLYINHTPETSCPFPGLVALTEHLQKAGVVTAVLTNTDDTTAKKLIHAHYADRIPFVAGAKPGIPPKPDPTLLCSLLQKLNADKTATLFVGDTCVDVQTAHAAGLPCCGVSWGYSKPDELAKAGADFIVNSSEELEHLIFYGAAYI